MSILHIFAGCFILIHLVNISETTWCSGLPWPFNFFCGNNDSESKKDYSDCTTKHDMADISVIQRTLRSQLHGQHLAESIVIRALKYHLSQTSPRKALVMSFHGAVGVGKTYAAGIIALTLCRVGRNSQNVHFIQSTRHFPHSDNVNIYKRDLSNWIEGNVSKCAFNLFVIDEVDKMPIGVMDAIKPFVDSTETKFSHCIFIFLSNTGTKEINAKLARLMNRGKKRESVIMKDMKELEQKGVYGYTGGLQDSAVLKHGLVDFYVPFLPLEESHVKLCIQDAFERQEKLYDQHLILEVLDLMELPTNENESYFKYGCRPVYSNVGFVAASQDEL